MAGKPWRLAAAAILAVLAPLGAEAAAPVGQWWNAGYHYRQKLNLTSGTTAIPTQYSVRLQVDHAAFVTLSQSLASGNDVRIAWWSGTGWVELDRLLDDQSAWNTATTQVWFRTQAAIGASSTDDNYYLYYGNPPATGPPANWANVFLFYDDFGDGSLDAGRWTCLDPYGDSPPASCVEAAGTLTLGTNDAIAATAGYAFGTDTRWESRLRLATNLPPAGSFYNHFGASDFVSFPPDPYSADWITFWASQFQHETEASNNNNNDTVAYAAATATSFHVHTFDREGATGVRFLRDGALVRLANAPVSIPNANLRALSWNDGTTASGIVLDWVRVRKYVTPEPTFTSATAETGPSEMRLVSGTYTGNGVNNRPVFVGFKPDVVFIDRYDPALPGTDDEAVVATSTMPAGLSKFLDAGSGALFAGNAVVSLDTQGFTIGTHNNVNQSGITYYWVAFRAAPGQLKLGSYVGAPAAQDVTSVGFSPAYVIVLSEDVDRTLQKTSAMPTTFSQDFNGTGYTDAILDLRPDGFRVGADPNVNTNGTTYHYLAWAPVPGKVAVGTYVGGLPDGTNITGTGFWPEWVIVNRSNNAAGPQANVPVHKPASSGVGADFAVLFDGTNAVNNNIQNLQADGFQIGSHARVNSAVAPNNYHWVAFGPHTPATNYRSIGDTAVTYGTSGTSGGGTRVSVSNGSAVVAGLLGTTWYASNRGRGDVVTIPCDNPPTCTLPTAGVHYMILGVASDTSLLLSRPYQGSDNPSASYLIRRQFATPQAWEDCIDGQGGSAPPNAPCYYFPAPSASLVVDDRSEIGVVYDDLVFTTPVDTVLLSINGSTTDATHTITLTADGPNRHYGIPGSGVRFQLTNDSTSGDAIEVRDRWVTVEWIELLGASGPFTVGADAIEVTDTARAGGVTLRYNLIHHVGAGIQVADALADYDVYDNFIYSVSKGGIEIDPLTGSARIFNNTVFAAAQEGYYSGAGTNPTVVLRNNIARSSAGGDYVISSPSAASGSNISGDGSAVGAGSFTGVCLSGAGCLNFVSPTDLHLQSTSFAIDKGADLSAFFRIDIDSGVRSGAWDIGADEFGATTAVRLQSFTAVGADASVLLEWRTGSELDNLGFHVYRGSSADGPWTRLTTSMIPGLGSSALGQGYSFHDAGLVNGTRYFYRLVDVDTSSKATSHGPVAAVPVAATSSGSRTREEGKPERTRRGETTGCPEWVFAAYASTAGADVSALACTRHGDPETVSLEELSRDSRQATLELRTGGFYALREPSGRVRVYVPGFEDPPGADAAALPVRRALVEAVVGRRVQLGGVRALELARYTGLEPSLVGKREMRVSADGTVRAGRRAGGAVRGVRASDLARLMPSVFQGETKSAVVELSPLRYDARSRTLTLSRRVLVRLLFTGREPGESGRASRGRRAPKPEPAPAGEVLARLYTTGRGLHAVAFEELFPGRSSGLAASELSLKRKGQAVAFQVEPAAASFGPGSRLFFFAEAAPDSSAFSSETAWELRRSTDGVRMAVGSAAPAGGPVRSAPSGRAGFEVNRIYQPGLLDAGDLWLWDAVASGATRTLPFTLAGVDTSGPDAALEVQLQGASESGQAVDHHLRVSLGGVVLGETRFAGKQPHRLGLSVPAALLRDGANELQLQNVADTGVSSLVFLDRFTLSYPQVPALSGGVFEAAWPETGAVSVAAAPSASVLLDVTAADTLAGAPRWLTGFEALGGTLRFGAEAGRLYLVASRETLPKPRVAVPLASTLRSTTNQADYLLVAPRAFLAAAEPLVARRQDQGLAARAVAFEEIADEFGHGQPSAEAIRSFIAYAYHSWAAPSARYVLLLGDASYDPRRFMATSQASPLPALFVRSSYLWTASDPRLAAVNGDDGLPDLAIGRLPATSLEQAQTLVDKLLAWEDSGQGLAGAATLVADNPDPGGDFEANARDIAESYLPGRSELVLLRELGTGTRPRIQAALDSGLSFLSYVGHGGAAVWASENVWNSWDAASLLAQSQQPLLLTMNCLNGYFVAPAFDSLSESLVKAAGRGAIAAFSPSGLSLDGPAHQYQRALLAELTSGRHERLGDAITAAQTAYSRSGLMPELLSIYHLLGDPAMRIR